MPHEPNIPPQKLLRMSEVSELTGLARSTIYGQISARRFPKPIRAPGVSVALWPSSEINSWIEKVVAASAENQPPAKATSEQQEAANA
jgi:prophage regulatory protein